MATADALARVDHLVYTTDELERGIAAIEALLGVRAIRGGRHPQWGTCNALLALGERSYLEIIAPDPGLAAPPAGRPFGLDAGAGSRLAAWAANGSGLEGIRVAAAAGGVGLGNVQPGSRLAPGGAMLEWTLTDLRVVVAEGVVPFLIDWGRTPHPALVSPKGARLTALRIEHPDAARVSAMLHAIGCELQVDVARSAAIIAEIDCPRGHVTLR